MIEVVTERSVEDDRNLYCSSRESHYQSSRLAGVEVSVFVRKGHAIELSFLTRRDSSSGSRSCMVFHWLSCMHYQEFIYFHL